MKKAIVPAAMCFANILMAQASSLPPEMPARRGAPCIHRSRRTWSCQCLAGLRHALHGAELMMRLYRTVSDKIERRGGSK